MRVRRPLAKFIKKRAQSLLKVRGPIFIIADETSTDDIDAWVRLVSDRVQIIAASALSPIPGLSWFVADNNAEADLIAAGLEPAAVVFDATLASSPDRMVLWQWMFFHVRQGGHYVAPVGPQLSIWADCLDFRPIDHRGDRERQALASAAGRFEESYGYIAIPKIANQLLKLKDRMSIGCFQRGNRIDKCVCWENCRLAPWPSPPAFFSTVTIFLCRNLPLATMSPMYATTGAPSMFRKTASRIAIQLSSRRRFDMLELAM